MRLQLIRNATLKIEYAGCHLLIDPYLGSKHSGPSFAGISPNPTVDLPIDIDNILRDVQLVIVSHLHEDHFDDVAKERVPKDIRMFCQPGDETEIRASGFTDVTPLVDTMVWQGITFTSREGSHGLGPVLEEMGTVMGFSLEADGEPSLYWTGDTVLYQAVEKVIEETNPHVIVTHSCGAVWDGDLIVMDADETIAVCELSRNGRVVATHMESLDHATVNRSDLRHAAASRGISASKLLIPVDGETIEMVARK